VPKYIYLPRSDEELVGMVQNWNEDREDNDQYHVLHHGKNFPLRDVKPGDRLYVFGHGNLGKGIGPTKKGLTAKQLAKRIDDDGLPKTHPEIRLFACNTAVKMHNQVAPYAARFARAMAKRDYLGIFVVGYIGFVCLSRQGHKRSTLELSWDKKRVHADKAVTDRAKERKQVFYANEDGAVVTSGDDRWVGEKTVEGKRGHKTTLYKVVAVSARQQLGDQKDDDDEAESGSASADDDSRSEG
jgi:hypothetical protein